MTRITVITTETNAHAETVEVDRYSVPATIDKVSRETVEEDRNERKGYDLVCFVKPGDVPEGLDLMTVDFLIDIDGLTYDPAKIDAQRGFGGTIEHYTIKARLA
ncbi:hypothetical protein [Pseudodesulfovibrio senegalensis]|uniref:Uncharacterized protein n=1 Tax=Pseudodesulfovibrio senegalensis TaxID=1721087 RepID=A0A6N6N6F8_9BACT|nr:hypothetical protein [Pseudodesulfovibrio senegalensis]KAB1443069.1 hypothetical protein F8A88_02050 [Pseudodesulfovibrio senegalensis]